MRLLHVFLWLVARIVPRESRSRWLEEWRAEIAHGRWTMAFGAPADAWALRRLPLSLDCALNRKNERGPRIFHALDQDVRYALRAFGSGKSFTLAVIGSLAIGIAATTTAFAVPECQVLPPLRRRRCTGRARTRHDRPSAAHLLRHELERLRAPAQRPLRH